jgi:GNAT superfamily N-acetyltransferase
VLDLAQVSLRPAHDGDRNFAYDVKKAAMRIYIEPIWGWDEDFQLNFHRSDWEIRRPEIIMLANHGIGTMEIVRSENGFHLGEFYLYPEYQRQGIGLHLLQRLLQEADRAKLPIQLEVIKINPVQSLYLRCGFVIAGETKTHYLMQRLPK